MFELARNAAAFARQRGHDGRTLFLAAELRGNLELLAAGDRNTPRSVILELAGELMRRQTKHKAGLAGYFTEQMLPTDFAPSPSPPNPL